MNRNKLVLLQIDLFQLKSKYTLLSRGMQMDLNPC